MFTGGTLASDLALSAQMSEAAGGIPCSTTTLATISALEFLGDVRDVSIAVPYTPELTAKVGEFFTGEGYTVHAAECMSTTPSSNIQIAECTDAEIKEVVRRSVFTTTSNEKGERERMGSKAVLVTCTNWPATPLIQELEEELGVVVVDSIAVTLWEGLRMVGFTSKEEGGGRGNMREWGKLMNSL